MFEEFREFIDLAVLVNSRAICLDLARNLTIKKGSLCFYNILSTKSAVDNCRKIVAGSAFTKGPCDELMRQFFLNLKGLKSAKMDSSVVSVG